MKREAQYPRAQHFQRDVPCARCKRRSTGILHDYQNYPIGRFCQPCAKRSIAEAHSMKRMMPDMVQPENGGF